MPAQHSPRRDNAPLGIALTLAAVMVFGLQDALAKLLVTDHSPFFIVMLRYWGFAAFSVLLALRTAPVRRLFASSLPGTQMLRGVLLIADIWCFALALQFVPLAELQAISIVYPLLVTLFSIPLLGERVGPFRLGAVLVGFLGTLFILRPGGLPLGPGVVFAILASTFYALYIVFTRKVARRDPTSTSMVYAAMVGLVLSTAVGVFHWQALDGAALLMVLGLVITTCLGHGLMMLALSMVEASVAQPFNFVSLPWAITLSFVIFGHVIDFWALLGAVVIVVAGLVVMARERSRRTSATVAPASPPTP